MSFQQIVPLSLAAASEKESWPKSNNIESSYGPPTSNSLLSSLTSLGHLNNQTVNTYSHLLGAVGFLALPFYFYWNVLPTQPTARTADLVVVTVYCLGVATCFVFSAIFHTLYNHSCVVARYWNKLDYLGILVLMWGAGVPTIYYGFVCNPHWQQLYWTTTTVTAVGCTILTLNPVFGLPAFRGWRAALYAGFGLSSVIFVVHGLAAYGWDVQKSRMSLVWMGWMGTANLVGAVIYTARIPERWAPVRFDIIGASHQILHVAVLVASSIHFFGLMAAFTAIHSLSNPCSSS
ncbi:hypothetical protein DOTSEDRAFT_29774 [Dothistroma septosporum NZE10]|uniref:MPR-like GPCR protein n=1 Tax=Dothistroma septosporum (strain NZE10 / CBS 128990) TaxID=675120 RepID=M2XZA5_DOTSN|nr:hypothetical protein DOTSEDRAFT_29774 [Dothistroma septosporum NZE10]